MLLNGGYESQGSWAYLRHMPMLSSALPLATGGPKRMETANGRMELSTWQYACATPGQNELPQWCGSHTPADSDGW